MKVIVIKNAAGDIQSVALPNPALGGAVHMEQEGAVTHVLELDAHAVHPDDLMGKRGAEAQRAAHEILRRHLLK